jgi:hypothetical protein
MKKIKGREKRTEQDLMFKKFKGNIRMHMGFGYLDVDSICCEHGYCYARYWDDFLYIVHTIEYDGEFYSVKHLEITNKGIWTSGSSLEQCFKRSFLHMDLSKDPRYMNLADFIPKIDNYHMVPPQLEKGETNITCFPSGVLVNIHLVLNSENRHLINTLQRDAGYEYTNIFRVDYRRIYLLVLDISLDVHVEAVELATIPVDLANLANDAELISDTGIILPQKKYQAVIEIVKEKSRHDLMPIFLGSERDGYLTYGFMKEVDPDLTIDSQLYLFKHRSLALLMLKNIN